MPPAWTCRPALYTVTPVRYIVELDAQGHLTNRLPVDTADPASPLTRRGQRRAMPQVQRSSGIKPLLLADNAEYTLGLAREAPKQARVDAAHAAYLELLERCARATEEPAVAAVLTFLRGDEGAALQLPDDFDRGAILSFRVDGVWPTDLPRVQDFWAQENDPAARDAPVMQCLVCGQSHPVLTRLQGKIKGIPGGQTSGTAIISANAPAFGSYGLDASLIAPTCAGCGERFTKGLNDLIRDPATHMILGGAIFVFWTRAAGVFAFRSFMDNPQPEQVRELLAGVYSGKRMPEIDAEAFYAAVLSGSGGRAVVRDWIDTTVGAARQQLVRWFARQAIVDAYGEPGAPLGLYGLAAATVRDVSKDLAVTTPRALLAAALTGAPLPLDLLFRAVGRARAEREMTRPRAALIKLVLASCHLIEEDTMTELDLTNHDPAYLCGRLLAVLERAQHLAIPGAGTTIVDRYYGTASSAPATVFGTLLRGVQPHLAKLERDRPGAYHGLQRQLEDIQAGLSAFPATLTLQDQGLFGLGYYHQRAADRARAHATYGQAAGATVAAGETTENGTDSKKES